MLTVKNTPNWQIIRFYWKWICFHSGFPRHQQPTRGRKLRRERGDRPELLLREPPEQRHLHSRAPRQIRQRVRRLGLGQFGLERELRFLLEQASEHLHWHFELGRGQTCVRLGGQVGLAQQLFVGDVDLDLELKPGCDLARHDLYPELTPGCDPPKFDTSI